MPKISGNDIPSYADHQGHVTNARDEVFEVNPTHDVDGKENDGLTVEDMPEPLETGQATDPGDVTLTDAKRDELGIRPEAADSGEALAPEDDEDNDSKRDDVARPTHDRLAGPTETEKQGQRSRASQGQGTPDGRNAQGGASSAGNSSKGSSTQRDKSTGKN